MSYKCNFLFTNAVLNPLYAFKKLEMWCGAKHYIGYS